MGKGWPKDIHGQGLAQGDPWARVGPRRSMGKGWPKEIHGQGLAQGDPRARVGPRRSMGKGWPKEIRGLNNFISVKEIIISCQ